MRNTNFPTGADIRMRRQALGASQKQFVQKLSSRGLKIRQPYLSKIESGAADPSYNTMKEIISALNELENKKTEQTIGVRVRPRIVFANFSDQALLAAKKMRKNGFSQLPVYERGRHVGRITDAVILEAKRKFGAEEALSKKVGDIMGPKYPILDISTPYDEAEFIIEKVGAALIEKSGKIVGIVTREDLLE